MSEIRVKNISKSYGDESVLERVSFVLSAGSRTCLMGPSGSGKTTLMRILTGLEQADEGELSGLAEKRLGVVFQEDRLFEWLSALQNVRLTAPGTMSDAQLRREMGQILPEESLERPVSCQSGGMKRRIAVARAILAPADLLVLDEPFTGLDEDTKSRMASWILERQGERTLLFSSHQEEDVRLMRAQIIRIA